MSDKFMMSVRQGAELGRAFKRNGWTAADVKVLSGGSMLTLLLPVVRGSAKIVTIKHIIDCDANPYIPLGWKVEEHRKGGQFEWDPSKVALYLSAAQKKGPGISGNKLRKELRSQPVLNANVLDYLLANPSLIPEDWKGEAVCFWGTIYRRVGGVLYVRCLGWSGERLHGACHFVSGYWGGCPAAVRVSS